MSGRYIITTPLNKMYSGKVCGVRIENGRGILDSSTIDPTSGMTVETALIQLRDMPGYNIEVVPGYDDQPQPALEAAAAQAGYKKQKE